MAAKDHQARGVPRSAGQQTPPSPISRATKTLIDMLEDNETCPLDTELGGTHLPGRETRHCTSESQALATLEHIRFPGFIPGIGE